MATCFASQFVSWPGVPRCSASAGDGRRRVAWRALLTGAGVVIVGAAAAADWNNSRNVGEYKKMGTQLFINGDIQGSLDAFDKVLQLRPAEKPYLWQRGICLYYLKRFEEGAEQFREDIKVNPSDGEEAIWCFLCEARLYGLQKARELMIPIEREGRPAVIRSYELFKSGGDPQQVLLQPEQGSTDQHLFYSRLYAGLYYEASESEEGAKSAIVSACRTPYGLRYFLLLARNNVLDYSAEHKTTWFSSLETTAEYAAGTLPDRYVAYAAA